MGSIHSIEYAQGDLDTGLTWQLQANHYPPIPLIMLEPCKEAIFAGRENDWNKEIALPEGVLWKGKTSCPAIELIEHAHLYAWCEDEE
jgi:hypothetical protein